MAHGIEITNGKARMAYSGNVVPWHRLGTSVKGLQTIPEILMAANADFDVVTSDVAAVDAKGQLILNPDGTTVLIKDSRATIRVNADGSFNGLATVGTRYVVQQNREVLELAFAVVGASRDAALIDTCGVLNNGREFFAAIDLGSIFIDPSGINDEIQRYIVVHNGHDGKTPITFANTPIRVVCKNTVFTALQSASKVSARHTKNADLIVTDAHEVLRLSSKWAETIKASALTMMSIKIAPRSDRFINVVEKVFKQTPKESKTQERNRKNLTNELIKIYEKPTNAGAVGNNGWAMYNTVAEYLDHYREASPLDRATSSMNAYSWVSKKKIVAHEAILSLVN